MRVVGITRVKDELDIVGHVLRHMREQVDAILIEDNASTDGTREVLAEMADDRLIVVDDAERGYYQSRRMTMLALKATAELGADWVVPFDADEFWMARDHPTVGAALSTLDASVAVASAQLWNYVSTDEDDPSEPNPALRMRWRLRQQGELPKVACRPMLPATIEQGNHGAHYATETVAGLLVLAHFPYRSSEQLIRKARNGAEAYAAAPDLPAHQGDHWRKYGAMSDEQLTELFNTWWYFEAGDQGIVYDPPCPERQAA